MEGAWHVVKWVPIPIIGIYFVVQVLAMRRLEGELKRRSSAVLAVMSVFVMLESWIRLVFENREASRIAMLIVGFCAVIATAVLSRMLHSQRSEVRSGLSR